MNKLDFNQKMSIVQTVLLVMILACLLVRGTSGQSRESELAQHMANLSAVANRHDQEFRAAQDDKQLTERLNEEAKKLHGMFISTRKELFK